MESSFTILRVRGIPIGAHWSWVLVFVLVVWSLSAALFPATYPGESETTYLVMGIVAGVVFFTSILLHELGHAFQALNEGMKIEGITLWLFGGVARFAGIFPSAGAEFRIAVAGPAVSLVLAAMFGVLTWVGPAIGWGDPVQGVIDYLWRINALVLAFNLVPALPLDGGRVLRAWLWHRQKSFAAATESAARAGRMFGGLLVAVGILNFLTGASAGGLWFVFLGWFLIQAAQAEVSVGLLQQMLRGRHVRDLMTPDVDSVPPDMTIQHFLDEAVTERGHSTYPVLHHGDLVGLVSLRRAGSIEPERRPWTTVQEVMAARDEIVVLTPEQDASDALDRLRDAGRAAVVDDGRVVGFLSIKDIVRAVEVERARGRRQGERARRAGLPVWIVVGVIMVAAAGYLYHPPLVVMDPGPTIDITEDVEISGVDTTDVSGRYLLTSVEVNRPNGLSVLLALARRRDVIPATALVPEGVDEEEFVRQQREMFEQSRTIAAAAAARNADMQVTVEGSGAEVVEVMAGTPAERALEPGDVIVEVDGQSIDVATDLQDAIRSRPAGSRFELTIERDGATRSVTVESERLPQAAEGITGIGVFVSTRDFGVDLPFEVDFQERDVGGPSAGLIYSLAVADMIDRRDLAAGRDIAATGTIDLSGDVGAIGGVDLKAISLEDENVDIFFVPRPQVDEATEEEVQTRGVSTLEEAVRVLGSS